MTQMAERTHANKRRPVLISKRPQTSEPQSWRPVAQLRGPARARVTARSVTLVTDQVTLKACERNSAVKEGLPPRLRAGVEALSGIAMDDVRVHRNSAEPAKLGALAFTKGTEIHLGPGQERHLPHEAWHVVQQKQGRVKATAQMKGAAINVDAALEHEADAVAATKLEMAADRPATDLRRADPAGRPITQAKLQWHGNELHYDPAFSLLTNYLIASPEKFILRKDVNPKGTLIHVLNVAKKYLLGEAHNASNFDDEAKLWPGVTLMSEGYKRIPHEAEDTAGLFAPPRRWDQQPIDSSHAYLFISLMGLLNHLETVLDDIDRDKSDDRSPGNWYGHLRDTERSLDDVKLMYNDYYKAFLDTYEKKFEATLRDPKTKRLNPPPHRLGMIRTLSAKLRKTYTSASGEMKTLAKFIKKIHGVIDDTKIPRKGWSASVGKGIKKLLPFISGLAKDLVPIISTDPGDTRILQDFIPPQPNLASRDPQFVLHTVRNRTMIESVRNEPAPVLVRLGDAHVDPVADGVGPDAVAIHIPKGLSDLTMARML